MAENTFKWINFISEYRLTADTKDITLTWQYSYKTVKSFGWRGPFISTTIQTNGNKVRLK